MRRKEKKGKKTISLRQLFIFSSILTNIQIPLQKKKRGEKKIFQFFHSLNSRYIHRCTGFSFFWKLWEEKKNPPAPLASPFPSSASTISFSFFFFSYFFAKRVITARLICLAKFAFLTSFVFPFFNMKKGQSAEKKRKVERRKTVIQSLRLQNKVGERKKKTYRTLKSTVDESKLKKRRLKGAKASKERVCLKY